MTTKFKREAKRLLTKYNYCPHPSCKEHFDTEYDLAKHIVDKHEDMVDMALGNNLPRHSSNRKD